MKKFLFLGIGSALMFTMGGIGSAQADTSGSIHKSTAVTANGVSQSVTPGGARCAGCHRAHTAKAEYLLKQAQPGLCYTCHGGAGSALDVVDGVDPNGGGALRGGGFAYSLINGAGATMKVTLTDAVVGTTSKTAESLPGASAPVTSRHQIDGTTTGTIWGNGAISAAAGKTGVTLECGSCHDPHGNGNYRILRPVPNDAGKAQTVKVAAKPATVDAAGVILTVAVPAIYCTAADTAVAPCIPNPTSHSAYGYVAGGIQAVNIPDSVVSPRGYTTADYWNVNDRQVPTTMGETAVPAAATADGYITNVAQWCTTCHTRYLAGSGSYNTPNRGYPAVASDTTSPVDATFTYRHRSDKVGVTPSPNCIQCHVSHGTSAKMYDDENGSNNATFTAPDGSVPGTATGTDTAGAGANAKAPGYAGTVVGNSRLLRVDDRGTCKMCHNV